MSRVRKAIVAVLAALFGLVCWWGVSSSSAKTQQNAQPPVQGETAAIAEKGKAKPKSTVQKLKVSRAELLKKLKEGKAAHSSSNASEKAIFDGKTRQEQKPLPASGKDSDLTDAPRCSRYPNAPILAYRTSALPPKTKGGPNGELREWLVKVSSNRRPFHVDEEWFPGADGKMAKSSSVEYAASVVVVKVAGGCSDEEFAKLIKPFGAEVENVLMEVGEGARLVSVRVPDVTLDSIRNLTASLGEVKEAVRVEKDFIQHSNSIPNDTHWSDLWGMAKIHAPEAWDTLTSASSVIVGILDSGVNYNHEDLAANMWRNTKQGSVSGFTGDLHGASCVDGVKSGDPMDDAGHGTHIAGTIGAVGNNGKGVVGIAHYVKLMALKAGDKNGMSISDEIAMMDYANKMGCKIVNCSFGGYSYNESQDEMIRTLTTNGVIFACAAGNESNDTDMLPHYPSSLPYYQIVSVAASTKDDTLDDSSCHGLKSVDIAAPGAGILSTSYDDDAGVCYKAGTSMAAPHVTGALALLKAKYPSESATTLIKRLYERADRVDALKGKISTGARLNVANAISETYLPAPQITAFQGESTNRLYVTYSSVVGANVYCVYRATSATATPTAITDWVTMSSTTKTVSDSSAKVGVRYWYYVKSGYATIVNGTIKSVDRTSAFSAPVVGWIASVGTKPDSWDPTDDTFSGATLITPTAALQSHGPHGLNSAMSGAGPLNDWADYFKVNLVAGKTYLFEAKTVAREDSLLQDTLANQRMLTLYSSASTNSVVKKVTASDEWRIVYTATRSGTHYLCVGSASRFYGTDTYALQYRIVGGDAWDSGDDSFGGATVLTPTTTVQTHGPHTLDGDDADGFKVSMTAFKTYVFETTGKGGTYGIVCSDANGTVAVDYFGEEVFADDGGENGNFRIVYTPLTSGDYYLAIFPDSSFCEYSLKYYMTGGYVRDLKFYTPSEWDVDGVLLSEKSDGVSCQETFATDSPIYVRYAYLFDTDVGWTGHTNTLAIYSANGSIVYSDKMAQSPLVIDEAAFEIPAGTLSAGSYTATVTLDTNLDTVNKTDNMRSRSFTVTASGSSSGGSSGSGTATAAVNDLAFYAPESEEGWTTSLWLSTADDAADKSEFTTADAIYGRYAYYDANGEAMGIHTNRVYLFRRTAWNGTSFDLDDYELESVDFHGCAGLDAGMYRHPAFAYSPLDAGEYAVIVWLDSYDQIAETDEGDNIGYKTFTVVAPKATVTFNANGGTLASGSATRSVTVGSAIGSLPSPTRSGYTFAGWYTSASGGTKISTTTVVSADVTYYAHWTANTVTVTFNANGGTASTTSRSVTVGSAIGSLPTATRSGYTFAGWWTSASGGTSVTAATVVSANVTYYAHWTAAAVNDLAFYVPTSKGWTTPLWLSTANDAADMAEFTTTDTIYCGYAYEDSHNNAVGVHTNYVSVWRRVKWDSSTFDLNEYEREASLLQGVAGLEAGKYASRGFTMSASTLGVGEYAVVVWLDCDEQIAETDESNNIDYKTFTVVAPKATVTFNANGGTLASGSATRSVTVGSAIGSLPSPTRSGYTFAGWYTSASGGTKISTTTIVSADVTYYAHWTANAVTVTFNANGGTASTTSRSVTVGSAIGSLPTATRSGYTFAGWWTSASGGTQITAATVVSASATYYAHWTQNAVNDLAFYVLTSKGWTASPWLSTADDASDKSEFTTADKIYGGYAYEDTHNSAVGSHTNYVAVYQRVKWESSTFDLTEYEYRLGLLQGVASLGVNGYISRSFTISAGRLDVGEYAVVVWLDCDEQIAETDEKNNIAIKTFKVVAPKATVTFNANGGTLAPSSVTRSVTVGSAVGSLPTPTRSGSGYTFAGWYTSASGGTKISTTTVVSADVTYYAHWTYVRTLTVKFDPNGGRTSVVSREVEDGKAVSSLPTATRTGYKFRGWYTLPIGGEQISDATVVTDKVAVYGRVTYYAQWAVVSENTRNDLEFFVPSGVNWTESMWLTDDENSTTGKVFFKPSDTIYIRYAYRDVAGKAVDAHVNRVFVLKRTKWNHSTFNMADYEDLGSKYSDVVSFGEDGYKRLGVSVNPNMLETGSYAVRVCLDWNDLIDESNESNNEQVREFTVGTQSATVKFNANGGSISPSMRFVAVGTRVGTLPVPWGTLSWNNHVFTGWYTSYNGSTRVTPDTVVTGDVTYYAHWRTGSYDSADFKDDTAKGAVNWPMKNTTTSFSRTLMNYDAEDNFKITGKDGALYDISLAFDENQVGCDAVFSITNANGQTVCDVDGTPIENVTSAKQVVLPKTKTPYYLTVRHGTAEKRGGSYVIYGQYADVGSIKFAKTAVNVKESAAYVDLTVNRTGKDGLVRVKYATAAGTAKPGEDYIPQNGVLVWEAGDKKAKKIRVTLIPDLVAKYDGVKSKDFSVKMTPLSRSERLSGEYPAVIAGGDTCTVTIAETSKPGTTVESVYAKQAVKRATVKTEVAPLESGTFYGLLVSTNAVNEQSEIGSLTFTASSAAVPALSAKAVIAGKTYSFKGKGWLEGWTEDGRVQVLENVAKIGHTTCTNMLYMFIDKGWTFTQDDWQKTSSTFAALDLNVMDEYGDIQVVEYWSLDFYRNNAKIQSYLDVAQKFAGYYTVSLMPRGCVGNGYLTLTIDNKGNAKVAGMLPDGTTKPSVSVKSCGIVPDSSSANGWAMYVPVYMGKATSCFGGTLRLVAERDEDALNGTGVKIVVDEKWNDSVYRNSELIWNNTADSLGYCDGDADGVGFTERLTPFGGWYDKVVNLQTYYLNYAMSIETEDVGNFPAQDLPSGYEIVTDVSPAAFTLAFENDKIVHDKKKIVKTNKLVDFEQSVNPCNVSVKFTRATGVFTGGCSVWSENWDGTKQKEITGFKSYGVFLLNRMDDSFLDDTLLAPGFVTKKYKVTGYDDWTGRKTTHNWFFSAPFNVWGEEIDRDWSEE